MAVKKWEKKLTKAQLAHIAETTQRGTLREVKANIEHQRACPPSFCFTCSDIAKRLGI